VSKLFFPAWILVLELAFASLSFAQAPGNFSTLSTTGVATLGGDVLACSGRPLDRRALQWRDR
jgi:hypothetical protein